jgi:hypothetical protein
MAQVIFTNGIAPATPGSGTVSLYTKTSDKKLYYKDDTGTEVGPIGGTDATQLVLTGVTAPAYAQGKLVYDTDNESLTFFNNDSAVALQIGQETWVRVRNDTGSSIPNGSAVYVSGTHASGLPNVALAQANSESTSLVLGIATETIANNSIGYVTAIGTVRNLNTASFTAGQAVYLSASVAGGLTATIPSAPNFRYRVGIVTRSNATTGTIHVSTGSLRLGNGTANQIFGMNASATLGEYKTLTAGSNITITHGANSVTIASSGGGGGQFKNKIIGGDFTTNPWQRGTTITNPTTGVYTADRWLYGVISSTVVNVIKTADAPTAAQAGIFTQHCLHIDVTTADASLAATDIATIQQRVEGLNAASFGFGQAGSRFVTISFWHKHTKTGTHCVAIRNSATDRSYVAEYIQDVSDTWERAEITIPVDTSGTWLYDTGIGLSLSFTLAAGTTLQTTANTWAAGNFVATANQVNNLDSTANNFKIALVQLEAGSNATAFETRSVGQELDLCERYTNLTYVHTRGPASAAGQIFDSPGYFKPMRASPTATLTISGTVINVASSSINIASNNSARHEIVSTTAGDTLIINRQYLLVAEL